MFGPPNVLVSDSGPTAIAPQSVRARIAYHRRRPRQEAGMAPLRLRYRSGETSPQPERTLVRAEAGAATCELLLRSDRVPGILRLPWTGTVSQYRYAPIMSALTSRRFMEGEVSVWMNALYSWAPVIVLVGFWMFLMRKFNVGRQAGFMERNAALMDRQVQLLERIAVALEHRNSGRS